MIQQEFRANQAQKYAEEASLYNQELTFHRADLGTMAGINAVFAGFIYKRMWKEDYTKSEHDDGFFRCVLITTFLINVIGVFSAKTLLIFGSMRVLKAEVKKDDDQDPEKLLRDLFKKIRAKRRMCTRIFISSMVITATTSCVDISAVILFNEGTVGENWIGLGIACGIYILMALWMWRIFNGMDRAFDIPPLMPSAMQKLMYTICCTPEDQRKIHKGRDYVGYSLMEEGELKAQHDDLFHDKQPRQRAASYLYGSKQQLDKMMTCHKCGQDTPASSKFCEKCGTLHLRMCANPSCHFSRLTPTCKHCPECAHPVSAEKQQELQQLLSPATLAGSKIVAGARAMMNTAGSFMRTSQPQAVQTVGEPKIASWLRKKKRMGQYQDGYYEMRVVAGTATSASGEEDVLYEYDAPNGTLVSTVTICSDTPVVALPGNDFKIGKQSKSKTRGMSSKLKGSKFVRLQALSEDSKRSWVQALETVSNNSVRLATDDGDDDDDDLAEE